MTFFSSESDKNGLLARLALIAIFYNNNAGLTTHTGIVHRVNPTIPTGPPVMHSCDQCTAVCGNPGSLAKHMKIHRKSDASAATRGALDTPAPTKNCGRARTSTNDPVTVMVVGVNADASSDSTYTLRLCGNVVCLDATAMQGHIRAVH